ncbi:MAG: PqqD family protein [Alphaproteobacteria bacterium]
MTRYRRNPGVSETTIDGETFLVDPTDEDIFYLDQITTGLWRILATPHTKTEILTLFHAAFPQVDADRLDADLTAALADLVARSLVVTE